MGTTNEETDEVGRGKIWTRLGSKTPQDDDGAIPFDDLHLHRYCDVYPFPRDEDDDALLSKHRERRDEELIEIKFVRGITRKALKHTPMVVLLLTIILFGSAEFMPGVQGLSVFLPPISAPMILFLLGGGVLYVGLGVLLVMVGLLDGEQIYRAVVVYGLLATLIIGTSISITLVLLNNPVEIPPNIIFVSGWLLLVLLGGSMIYDGMLRMEHMFEHLDKLEIVENKEEYRSFKRRLKTKLSHSVPNADWWPFRKIPTAVIFAVLFVSQFLVLWGIGRGPQNLDYSVTLYVNVFINIFLVIIAFQFLVLIKMFYELVTQDLRIDSYDLNGQNTNAGQEKRILGYQIDHEDGYAGYGELGKFASRVNVLLILAGLFLVYRLYVHSKRIPPEAMAPGFEPTVGVVVWFAGFVIPIIGWTLATIAWLYYSFWHLHLRMIRERERELSRKEEEKQDLKRRDLSPAWPVNPSQIMSIVSGALTLVTMAIIDLLP